jgi:hypothetical protein
MEANAMMAILSMMDSWPLAWPVLAFAATTAVALAVRGGILVGLRRPSGPNLSAVVEAIRRPSLLWCITLGLYAANEVALDASGLPMRWYAWTEVMLEAFVVVSVIVVLARIASGARPFAVCVSARSGGR